VHKALDDDDDDDDYDYDDDKSPPISFLISKPKHKHATCL